MNIGLLEDNPGISEVYTFALEAQGYTVSSHDRGRSLLNALLDDKKPRLPLAYDMLLVDLSLPGELSGIETLQILFQSVDPATLPVVILSGSNAALLHEAQRLFPTLPIFQKPVALSVLVHAVRQATSTAGVQEEKRT